jgi:hypothetical protein
MTIVGHCPHCGAPIYSPTVWHGVIPPAVIYSCNCVRHPGVLWSNNSANYGKTTSG